MNRFGEGLKAARQKTGLSLRDVHARGFITQGELSKYENNHVGTPLPKLDWLADLYGVPRTKLLLDCLRFRYPDVPEYVPPKKKGK